MNARHANAFQSAFRFHPRLWREQNELTAVSVLMDAAEATGRQHLSLSERASIYLHAASVWAEQVLNRAIRERVSSLALGTGMAMSVVYFVSFILMPMLADAFMPMSKVVSATALLLPWVAAGLIRAVGYVRGVRAAMGLALVLCVSVVLLRLWQPELALPSTLTVLFFGLWSVAANLGRARGTLTWVTAGVVAVLGVTVVFAAGLVGRTLDTVLWTHLPYVAFLPLVGLFLGLFTAAACRRSTIAMSGTVYAGPWAIILIAGFLRDGQPMQVVALLMIAWAGVSGIVATTARIRHAGPLKTTVP